MKDTKLTPCRTLKAEKRRDSTGALLNPAPLFSAATRHHRKELILCRDDHGQRREIRHGRLAKSGTYNYFTRNPKSFLCACGNHIFNLLLGQVEKSSVTTVNILRTSQNIYTTLAAAMPLSTTK